MTFFLSAVFVLLVFWRPQEWLLPWMFGFPLLDIIVALATAFLAIELNEGRLRFPRKTPQPFLIFGLWFAPVMSLVAHTYLAGVINTIPVAFKLAYFPLLLFITLDRTSRLRAIAWVYVAMALVMVVHALLQVNTGVGFAGLPPMSIPMIGDRPAHSRTLFFGIFGDPNHLGQIFGMSVPFAFVLTRRKSGAGMLLGLIVAGLLVEGLLTTHSRGGMVGLAAALAVMFVLLLPYRWFMRGLALVLIAGLALTPFSAAYLDKSAHDRVVFWGEANYVFKQYPLFGAGFRQFTDFIPDSRAAHNAFVLCYTELGLFGYWFWFILLQVGILGACRARQALTGVRKPAAVWLRHFAGMSVAAMVGFAASAYFLSRA
ncbi:MAG: hypothetical protein FJW35_18025, partial [Acidobacteria bacterium]|nr:hypothetical protein [Acidobacteriota bacterium]